MIGAMLRSEQDKVGGTKRKDQKDGDEEVKFLCVLRPNGGWVTIIAVGRHDPAKPLALSVVH